MQRIIIIAGVAGIILIAVVAGAFFVLSNQQRLIGGGALVPTPLIAPANPSSAALPTAPIPMSAPPVDTAVPVFATPSAPISRPGADTSASTPNQPLATATTGQPVQIGPLQPERILASATAPSSEDSQGNVTTFEPTNVSDSRLDTAWRVPGDGRNQWIELGFAQPIEVHEIQIVPGYAKIDSIDGTDRFTQNRRVQLIRLEFSDGTSTEARFTEIPDLQPIVLPGIRTTFVRIVVLQTTPPGSVDGRDFTPISEIVVLGATP